MRRCGELVVLGLALGDLPLDPGFAALPLGGRQIPQIELPLVEPQLLDAIVDLADLTFLQLFDLLALRRFLLVKGAERLGHGAGAAGDHLVAPAQLVEGAEEVPPFEAFQQHHVLRTGAPQDVLGIDPGEVETAHVPVAHLDPQTVEGGRSGRARARGRGRLLHFPDLAQQLPAVLQGEQDEVLLPEVAQAVDGHQQHDGEDQQEVEGEGAAAQPGERLAHGCGTPPVVAEQTGGARLTPPGVPSGRRGPLGRDVR